MKKILIIGSSGLLGSSLSEFLILQGYEVVTVTRTSLNSNYRIQADIAEQLDEVLNKENPQYIINLAALTDVALCETEPSLAFSLNACIPDNIARSSYKNSHVIHISTDHIYNSNLSKENEVVVLNNYAKTKLEGEQYCDLSRTTILRTNFFGKSKSMRSVGLCDSVYEMALSGRKLSLFKDVFFSPLSIDSLIENILLVIHNPKAGVYNLGSRCGMSKGDFISKFLTEVNAEFEYELVNMPELSVARPHDMRMCITKFEQTFSTTMPKLEEEIRKVANEYKV
ncbi:sugar nucleotide-binding protein [Vibrio hepatarius]|uniref:sugar nucleotide-binding protein n=1 Tax=Vibrio hepatarius TaxID=171383 RepID=UPI00142DE3EA|nr:sugar nucleotide-binding protein [Vibrio hepatarius]NIY83313.1 sugar nucleotide-binding protein [Vibrio hepatarius]